MCLPVDRPARALTSRAAARIAAVIRRNPNPPIARETLIKGLRDRNRRFPVLRTNFGGGSGSCHRPRITIAARRPRFMILANQKCNLSKIPNFETYELSWGAHFGA